MFENKNFQSWFKENTPKEGLSETTTFSKQFVKDAWDNGYYVGYNKANEWHYVEDGDLPKEDLRPRTLGYYLTASKHKSYKGFVFEVAYFTGAIFTKGGDILDSVIAWKEIVLPKEI